MKISLVAADHLINSLKSPMINKTMGKSQSQAMGNRRLKNPMNLLDMADKLSPTPPGKRVLAIPLKTMNVAITAGMVVIVDLVGPKVLAVAEAVAALTRIDLLA